MTLANASGQTILPGDSGGPCFLGGTIAGVNSTFAFSAQFGTQVSVPDVRDWALGVMVKPMTQWNSAFSDANGWDAIDKYSTIAFPDVNNDGSSDVCGRGVSGINCALSNGSSAFTGTALWNSAFSDANGWTAADKFNTIAFPDVNGDNRADVCGRGGTGINCALSNGSSSFTGTALWNSAFSDVNGWTVIDKYSTIQFADVNGDNRADVCGRGFGGINCALSNGSSAFTGVSLWNAAFSDANGWNVVDKYSTIRFADVNGDGRADVCGRGVSGINCGISNGSSAFSGPLLWSSAFSDASGSNQPQYFRTIFFKDMDQDGRADMCGRGIAGTHCAFSNGTSFTNFRLWTNGPSDGNGWAAPKFYTTLGPANAHADQGREVCGRGSGGIFCAN